MAKPNFKRDFIKINTTTGVIDVEAWCHGLFAIHRPLGRNFDELVWTITHLPTGMSLASGNCRFARLRDAKAATQRIAQLSGWDEVSGNNARHLGIAVKCIAAECDGIPYEPPEWLRAASATMPVFDNLNSPRKRA